MRISSRKLGLIGLLLLLAQPSWAAISLVQTATPNTVSATTDPVTFSSSSSSGDLIVASWGDNSNSFTVSFGISGATCSGGAFTLCPASQLQDSSGNATSQIAWCLLSSSGTVTVTSTLGGSEVQAMNLTEWAGIKNPSPADVCSTGATAGGVAANPTIPSTGTLTTTNASDLVIGNAFQNIASAGMTGLTSGFTQSTVATSGGATLQTVYQITSATGNYGASWTSSLSSVWAGTLATFKAATTFSGTQIGEQDAGTRLADLGFALE